MHPSGADIVVLRYGEIGVKSERVRARMAARLRENVAAVLAGRGFDDPVERERSRLYVHTTEDRIEDVTDAVTDVFGVVSASPARRVEPTLAACCTALVDAARDHYVGGSFAVRARRAGPESVHPFSSTDIERDGGEAVWEAAESEGIEPSVDLDDPDLTLWVECRQDDAYVFLEKRDGPGGLPLGTQQPLVATVSGGIDSPVAAWEVMKRGCPVYPLYIDLGEYGGVDHRLRAEETVRTLWEYAPNFEMALRVAPGGDGIRRIATGTERFRMLVLRRFMYRIADHVAASLDAVGIVSGEAIGQKSSQTAANLRVTGSITDVPVHRPLLARDKTSVTRQAREIGTFEDATIRAGCNRLVPSAPATRASPAAVDDAEPDGIERLAREAARDVTVVGAQTH